MRSGDFQNNMSLGLQSMEELDAVYKEAILDLYRNPLNKKILANFDVEAREANPSCGDYIRIQIKFKTDEIQDKRTVMDIGHSGEGCAISQAAVSLLTDYIKGKTFKEIQKMKPEDMLRLLQIPISYTRMNCALLGLEVLQQMTKDN